MDALLSPDPSDIWKNRRRFAYGAGAMLVLITFAAIFKELPVANAELLGNLAYAFATIIGAYIGFAVLDTANKRRTSEAALAAVGEPIDREDAAAARQPARDGD